MELTEELKQKFQNYDKEKLSLALEYVCEYGHLEIVKYLLTSPDLQEHADIHAKNDYGFRWACHNGHLEIIKYFLTSPELKDHADIHVNGDEGFRWACEKGHLEVVKYLLTSPELTEHVDIHTANDDGFRWACSKGHLEIVTYFLLSFNAEQCINFQNTDYTLNWAIGKKYDNVILAMMKNLKNNHFMEYFECLSKIEAYNQELYEEVKNIEVEGLEVNPQETSLFI